jgi:hypothetical protein
MLDKALKDRQADIGITTYAIAKAIANTRGTTPQAVNSSVTNCLKNPEISKFQLVQEIVTALGGRIVIQWENITEIKV